MSWFMAGVMTMFVLPVFLMTLCMLDALHQHQAQKQQLRTPQDDEDMA